MEDAQDRVSRCDILVTASCIGSSLARGLYFRGFGLISHTSSKAAQDSQLSKLAKKRAGRNLNRSAVELAKDWRTDKMLRNLEALLLVADKGQTFLISGSGDVIDPDEPLAAIGSGGSYATAAARALLENTELSAREIAEKAMKIAGEICIYTNDRITIEELKG